ncbi:hypothetical protein C8J56DRAFT_859408 [Mycena floridula]|nr:hypothetical protein C8J56DRAFT_859408 [Mycena floridula]
MVHTETMQGESYHCASSAEGGLAVKTVTAGASQAELQELLDSNRVPSSVQEFKIKKYLAETLESLHEIDDRIQRSADDGLRELFLEEQADLQQLVKAYKSILHPIRRLPDEILAHIFLNFVDDDLENMKAGESMSSLHPTSMQWALSLVCVPWRSVVVSLPKLWSTIRLAPSDLEAELQDEESHQVERSGKGNSSGEYSTREKSLKGEKREEEEARDSDTSDKADDSDQIGASSQFRLALSRLRIQLQRSASRQLHVSVVVLYSRMTVDPHPVLQMLLPTSSRWKTLFILVAPRLPNGLHTFISSLKGQLPSVSTLHMLIPGWPDDLTSFAESAPMLKTLAGHPRTLERYKLPFSQITKYYTSRMDYDCYWLISLFRLLPNLETLDIRCEQEEDRAFEDDADRYPVQLAFLRKLISKRLLHSTSPDHSSEKCEILCLLTVPVLQDLDITLYDSTNELQLLLQRSQCSLVTLSLELHDVPDEECIELLRQIPSLVSLTLICTQTLAEKFIDTFIEEPSMLPALQSLVLQGDVKCEPDKLVQLLLQLEMLRPLLKNLEIVC